MCAHFTGWVKPCATEGCQQKVLLTEEFCTGCKHEMAKKLAESPFPDDPEREQKTALYEQFRLLKFTEGEAKRLADAWADPERISWWLEQGCGHKRAVEIAT